MANTILERIQEKYPGVADDARNIAEAMAMVSETGGRGAGAIADNIHLIVYVSRFPNGASGSPYATHGPADYPIDLSAPPASANWTAPTGKAFAGWSQSSSTTEPIEGPFYSRTNTTLYAIWVDAFTITFDANSGSGTIEPIEAADGATINLPDGSDLTAPTGKEFVGWGESALATEPVDDPYTVTDDAILYAIWDDVSAGE